MGNWTTVNITGTCSADELPLLKNEVNIGDDWDRFHCLCNTGGICGLNDWANEEINAKGNLAERDYGAEDIAEKLKELVNIAPSLKLKVHVGGDYESKECISTVNCINGEVTIDDPEIRTLNGITEDQIQDAVLSAIAR